MPGGSIDPSIRRGASPLFFANAADRERFALWKVHGTAVPITMTADVPFQYRGMVGGAR